MCNTLKASINSSITSLITCAILFNHTFNQTHTVHIVFQSLALFFFFVSLMQWYDTIFWLNQKDNFTNFSFTKIAMITNHLQPLVLGYLVSLHFKLSNITKVVLFMYTIYAIFYSAFVFDKIKYTKVTEKSTPVLDWQWNSFEGATVMYILFLLSFSLISLDLPTPINYVLLSINILTFGLSYHQAKKETIGKFWCILASYVPLFLVIIEMLFKF